MSKAKVFLHIGMEKTASTSVQVYLSNNFSSKRQNTLYPHFLRHDTHHLDLYLALKDGSLSTGDLSNEISRLSQKCEKLIFSTEHFSFPGKESYTALCRFIEAVRTSGMTPIIVCSVREAISFITSLYSEALKWGEVRSLDQFAKESICRLWVSRFAQLGLEANCEVRFLRFSNYGGNFISELLDQLELRPDINLVAYPGLKSNISLPREASEILFKVNNNYKNQELTRKIVYLLDRYQDSFINQESVPSSLFNLTPETVQKMQKIQNLDAVRYILFVKGHKSFAINSRKEVAFD